MGRFAICVLVVAGCSFRVSGGVDGGVPEDASDAGDAADAIDADPDVDAFVGYCLGAAPYRVCMQDAPTGTLNTGGDIDTDACMLSATAGGIIAGVKVPAGGGGPMLCVFGAHTLSIPNATLTAHGSLPLVLLAVDKLTVTGNGVVDVSSTATTTGAGGDFAGCVPGTAGAANDNGGGGGAGGSFGRKGGDGGDAEGAGGVATAAVTTTILRGGCAGTRGGAGDDGAGGGSGRGGGAVFLLAGNTLKIDGDINASGGGGLVGGDGNTGGGGGGSGGMIVLFTDTGYDIKTDADVWANGGGGGGGSDAGSVGQSGQSSPSPTAPGPGGSGGASGATDGGDGAFLATAGRTPLLTASKGAGGGGGGGGVIVNASSHPITTGRFSPPPS